jgi:6-phosphogluconolactonase
MTDASLHVSDDPAAPVAALLADEAARGGTIVLTGGSTPARAYELAATAQVDWGRASVWWGDERCVPPGDPRSNYGLAARTLFDRLARQPAIHRMRGELAPAEAADAYDADLEGVVLDLVLLGLGPDSHVASLFPGSPQLAERTRRVTWGPAGLDPFVDRITMTLPTLLGARRLVVLVEGAGKADAVARAFSGEVDESFPASLLRTGEAPLDVYLDPEAATVGPARA